LSPFFHEIALHLEQPDASKHVEGGRGWRLLQLFHLADRLATLCTSEPSERTRQIPPLMLLATHDGIESNALVEIGDRVIVGLKEWGSLLGIEIPQIPSFDAMLNASSISSELTGLDALNGEPSPIYKLRILLVDDDRSIRLLYKTLLEKSGHTVTTACNGLEALELVKNCPPQLIISDWMMPEMDGIEFCRALRQNPEWLNIYVFIVTAQESTEKLIEAFEAGANDYLSKPINPRVLSARLRSAQRIIQMQEIHEEDRHQLRQFADELALSNQRLQELALTDTLTGLYNRRYGMDRLEQEWAMSIRGERPFCCMMVDIDHFKLVNDTYGHQFGDQALRLVASSLQNAARKQDVVCRFGGEEFIVICPDSDLQAGMLCAERLRQSVAATPLISQGKAIRLTVSIGVTDSFQLKSAEVMLHQADKRLYVAKATGRNCTVGR
jgi:diguanylate cyclase (GGDEF)-like protein